VFASFGDMLIRFSFDRTAAEAHKKHLLKMTEWRFVL
jgi:hypothetical protein